MDHSLQHRVRFLMAKYLKDSYTIQELEELFAIIKDHPEDKTIAEIIDLEAGKIGEGDLIIPEEISKSLFTATIRKRLASDALQSESTRLRPTPFYYWRIAAALLLGVVCSAMLYLMVKQPQRIIVNTAFGEINEVTLPDGSIVTLNGNSTIIYDPELNDNEVREVSIEGEAFFQVAHGLHDQKFKVHTSNNVVIEVLGTEFNVNERRSQTRVVLHSGKILLGIPKQGGHEDILMNPGEYVEVRTDAFQVVHKQVDSRLYISWKNKMLIFRDTPLRDIVTILEDRYGIQTHVNDSSLLVEQFTATYPSDNINVLIKALEKSFPIKVDSAEHAITIGE